MEQKVIIPEWTIVSEVELVYKSKVKASTRPLIKKTKDAYDLLNQLWNQGTIELQEEFKALFLNRANRVLGVYNLSKGGITGTVADPKLLLAAALKCACVGVILSHNHPSLKLTPSRADEEMTDRINQACKLLDLRLLDHIIITSEGYYSFADEGLL